MNSLNKQIEFVMFILLCILIIFIPLPYGSNRPWAMALIESVVFFMTSYILFNTQNYKSALKPEVNHINNLVYFFLIWIAYQIILVIPIPIELVQILSEQRYANHIATFPDTTKKYLSISYNQYTSVKSIISNLTFIALFFTVYHLVNTKRRLFVILWLIVISGLGQALYGIIEMYNYQHSVGSSDFITHAHTISGSFINRNHFSAYIIFAIAACSVLILNYNDLKSGLKTQSLLKNGMTKILDYRFHLKFYLFVFIAALLYSQSRGAELGLLGAIIIGLFLFLLNKNKKFNRIIKFGLFMLPVALFVTYMASEGWLNRFQFLVENAPQRLIIWQTSLEIFYDYWLTGVGPGNYQFIYPIYQTFGSEYFVDHAHNDSLELLVEQGIPGLILLAFPLFSILIILFRYISKYRNISTVAIHITAFVVTLALLLHSFVDFIFQIPAITAYFFVFLALALRTSRE